MEIKIFFNEEEKKVLGLPQDGPDEVTEGEAYPILMEASAALSRTRSHMDQLRGHEPGARSGLNAMWHRQEILAGVVDGLNRVLGVEKDTVVK